MPSRRGAAAPMVLGVCLLSGICGVAILVVTWLLPAERASREASLRAQSQNNLKIIGLALHRYHDACGTFPPAAVADDAGQPLYSGRVLLLPFLVVEIKNSGIYWSEPRDLDISHPMPLPKGNHPQGNNVLMADGA